MNTFVRHQNDVRILNVRAHVNVRPRPSGLSDSSSPPDHPPKPTALPSTWPGLWWPYLGNLFWFYKVPTSYLPPLLCYFLPFYRMCIILHLPSLNFIQFSAIPLTLPYPAVTCPLNQYALHRNNPPWLIKMSSSSCFPFWCHIHF